MVYIAQYSERFLKNFANLHSNEQKSIKDAVEQLLTDPTYPSLRTKRIQSARKIKPPIFEASANKDLRISWQIIGKDEFGNDILLLRNCGHHDRTLSNP